MAERATVARPYAKAAFACATDAGRIGEWSDWLSIAGGVVASDDYALYARNPEVRSGQLVELIGGVCGERLDAQGRALLGLLAENGRLQLLPEIASHFAGLRAERENIADVEIVSAVELDAAQRELIAAAMRGRLQRAVRLQCSTDPTLIGGAIVRSGDLLIDGSLKGKLERMQTELTG